MTSLMSPALWSLLALLAAILLSVVSKIDVGLVAIAFAWGIGVYVAGLKPDAVMAGFPASLFLTLTGVTLLFALADVNGTLSRASHRVLAMARGRERLLPAVLFLIAMTVSTVGPGAISSVALVIPMAMAIGTRAGMTPMLVSLMVANGANAGNLSPFSSVGVIANSRMAEAGIVGHEWLVWFANFASHLMVAAAGYWLLRLWRPGPAVDHSGSIAGADPNAGDASAPFNTSQKLTGAVILAWITGVVVLKLSLGLGAFAAAALLLFMGVADESAAIKKVPWGVIVMVTGVSVLIGLLEKTGGMELFASLLARFATPASVNGVIAFVTGAISTYSSTSGVVLPAFLPTIPSLVKHVGGGDPLAIALSINVGSALVDVSPLSTLGALCVATVTDGPASKDLFRRLLIWGLSMTIVGAVLCQLFAGILARWS
jgi:di/tricarboxylate transporter